MESKYYTPTIEQFYVGFEYQEQDIAPVEWVESKFTQYHQLEDIAKYIEKKEVRVKYLDYQDVISEGWEQTSKMTQPQFFTKDKYRLVLYNENFIRIFNSQSNVKMCLNKDNEEQLFCGTIRNKSELRMVMKLIGIK